MIAALFVEPNGVYANVPGVDPWPKERDARTYAGVVEGERHGMVSHARGVATVEAFARAWMEARRMVA